MKAPLKTGSSGRITDPPEKRFLNTLRILVIDDDREALLLFSKLIPRSMDNIQVLTANTGREGLELAREKDPDVIMLDILMPEMDGFEVCRTLKQDEKLRWIPVVFLTGLGSSRDMRIKALEVGGEAFLSKPFDDQELVAQIRAMAKIKNANRIERNEKERLAAIVAEKTASLEKELQERVRTEEALRESESRYRELFEAESDAVLLIDNETGGILAANGAAEVMYGFSRDELLCMKNIDLSAQPDETRRVTNETPLVIDNVVTIPLRYHRKKDGTVFPVEITGRFFARNGRPVHIAAIRDISLRMRTEEKSELSGRMWQTTFDNISNPIAVLDSGGVIVQCNRAMVSLLKKSDEKKVAGQLCRRFIHSSESFIENCPFVRAKSSLKREELECTLNGRCYVIAVDPILDPKGCFIGAVHLMQDITEHRRMEDELAMNETRFKQLFENMSSGVAVYTPVDGGKDFVFIAFNAAAERIDGQKREEVLGKSVLEMRPGIMKFGLFEVFQRVARTGNPENHPVSLYADGKLKGWYENYVYRLPSGEIVAIFDNVTEMKIAEIKEHKNELRLRSLLNILQYRGGSKQEFLDYALDEAIKLTESKLGYIYFYDEDRRQFILNSWSKDVMKQCAVANPQTCYELDKTGIWGEAVRQRKPIILNDFEAEHPLKKGYPKGHVNLTRFMTVPVFKGEKIVAVVGMGNKKDAYDDTDLLQLSLLMDAVWKWVDQRQSEDLLKESERKYRALAEHSIDTIMRFDRHHRHLYVNPVIQRQTGISPESFLGKTHWEMGFPEDLCVTWENAIEKVFESGQSNRIEFQLPSGTWIDWVLAPEKDLEGDTIAVVAVARDITERKNSEEALIESKAQLENSLAELKRVQSEIIRQERLAALGQMAGGIAHDFNNVLMPIVGFSELMLSDPQILDDREQVLYMIGMIATAGKDARRIVSRLRVVYKKKDDDAREMADMAVIVESAISLTMPHWKEEASTKGITISVETDFQTVPMILCNVSDIREAIVNLIINAVDAMPQGGLLHFGLRSANDGSVVLEVRDSGAGMDQETLARCMDPFYTTKGAQGSGLGLPMVNGIVERHGGRVAVNSRPGAGTTVTLTFPLPSGEKTEDKVLVENTGRVLPRRILVIDDEERARELISGLLKADSHEVVLADCGAKGLQLLREGSFDLVITDLAMPVMNGDEVARRVQEIRSGIPVIMLTGFGDIIKAKKQIPAGVTGILTKPVTPAELRSAIGAIFGEAGKA